MSPAPSTTAAASPPSAAPARFQLVSSTVMPLTQEELHRFAAIPSSVLEREKSEKRVRHLYEKIMAGQAVTFHWVTAEREDTGETIRGNGFHSSDALARFDGNLPDGLKVLREHYKVKDGNTFAELFQQFDDRVSARQSHDVAGVYQALHPALADVDRKLAKLAIDGMKYFRATIDGVTSLPIGDMIYGVFGDEHLHPYIKWIADVLDGKTAEMRRKEVVAAMFATFDINESAARDWWEKVANRGDPDQADLPETVLDAWLLAQKDQRIDRINGKELYAGCIYCWNAHRDERRVSQVRYAVAKKPPQVHD